MSISIKSAREIELMRESNRLLGEMHNELAKMIRPGISTLDLDKAAARFIKDCGCVSNFLNYEGYPGNICTSVNEEVVHGIPKAERILKEGDIISIDAGMIYKGYHSDAARTYAVGKIAPEVQKLIDETRNSFFEGIKKAKAGNHLYEISNAIADYIEQFGFGIVRDLVGHGVGTSLHEEPQIPNFHMKRKGPKLEPGMTLAIEPMIALGRGDVDWLDDDWTVVTEDRSPAAHYENTILITDGEPEILSLV
ncbi:MAG: Methionine aminopeptidase 1 [Firmicutes bacterium ADurb.Bin354]|nr:MAG: Methionine aminopeptidase 1 [Firmicutes bacterium ADurb.Bin354]